MKRPHTAALWAVFFWAFVAIAGARAQGFEVQAPPPGLRLAQVLGTDLSGRSWTAADLRGKAVLVNFWASWCEPCRAEMPALQALQAQHPDTLVVLAVNYKESPESVERFVQREGWALPVLTDAAGQRARAWGVHVFPTSVVFDRKGRAVALVRGEVDWLGQARERWLQAVLRP